MIGVARPTRGVEFAESAQSIERNLAGFQYVTERSWDKSIPDCFNDVTSALLAQPTDLIWFVEEDVVVPPGAFALLLNEINNGADIAVVNYFLKKQEGVLSVKKDEDDNILWVSLGCTLVKASVFSKIEYPWFRIGYTGAQRHCGSSCIKRTWHLVKNDYPYGGQDCYFSWKAREAGCKIVSVDAVVADHLIIEELGMPDNNVGCHKIKRVKRIRGSK
jgi:hypothetical protein